MHAHCSPNLTGFRAWVCFIFSFIHMQSRPFTMPEVPAVPSIQRGTPRLLVTETQQIPQDTTFPSTASLPGKPAGLQPPCPPPGQPHGRPAPHEANLLPSRSQITKAAHPPNLGDPGQIYRVCVRAAHKGRSRLGRSLSYSLQGFHMLFDASFPDRRAKLGPHRAPRMPSHPQTSRERQPWPQQGVAVLGKPNHVPAQAPSATVLTVPSHTSQNTD